MWGNQLSDNYNTTTEFVNERKKTNFVKHSEQWDYLNRIEMKKNKPMNMFIWEHRMTKCLFIFVYKFSVLTSMLSVRLKQTDNIEVKTQNLLHRKQTNLRPLRKLCYFMIVYFDPKFTAFFCMFWSLSSVTRNSFLLSLVKFFWGFKVDQMTKYNTHLAF